MIRLQPLNALSDATHVTVALDERAYDVTLVDDLAAGVARVVAALSPAADHVAIVSDELVGGLWSGRLAAALRGSVPHAERITMPSGEAAKTLAAVEAAWDRLVEARFTRRSVVIALGGGSIGDAAGFAAATFLRGIRVVQAPTTLLAMVDASVGGKTGINRTAGKNLIGAFHQPAAVVIDPGSLRSLPAPEVRSGLAEVIKAAVIADRTFVTFLEDRMAGLLALEPAAVRTAILRAVEIKGAVVAFDEREDGLREILNYGHTFGHALEAATGFASHRHGEAVALGMIVAGRIAAARGMWPEESAARIEHLLDAAGLSTHLAEPVAADAILDAMRRDKKVRDGTIRFVLPTEIGRVETRDDVALDEIVSAMHTLSPGASPTRP